MAFTNFRWIASFPFMAYDGVVCQGNPWMVIWSQFLAISLLILFCMFYVQVYILKKDRKLGAQQEARGTTAGATASTASGDRRPTTPAKPHAE